MRLKSTQQYNQHTNVISSSRNSNNHLGITTSYSRIRRRTHCCHPFLLIIALVALTPAVSSENSVGCNIDPDVCDQNEICLDDNYLGICVSQADEPIRESLRSEALFYNTEEDHAPIRIHKYNIDDDEEVDDQTENELVDIKRDNIKDNYMDLERINLYSEKTKRSREPKTLQDLINLASLSDMPREEVESGEEPEEYYERDLDLSNSLSDDLADYNYEDLGDESVTDKTKDNLIDLLFDVPVEENTNSDDYSNDYADEGDYDQEDDERYKRSADLVIESPGLIVDRQDKLLLRPVLAEAAGLDDNGNSFYEQDLLVNGVGLDDQQQPIAESALDTLDTKELGQMINNLQKENDFIEEVIENSQVNDEITSPISAELAKETKIELTQQDLEDAVEQNAAENLDQAFDSVVQDFIQDLNTGDESSQAKVSQVDLVKKDTADYDKQEHSQDASSYSDSDLGQNGHFGVIDPSYVTIEFSDKINEGLADDLIDYISRKLHLSISSFQEFSVQDNSLSFKFKSQQVTSKQLADSISSLSEEIKKDKGLSIVSCGIGKKNNLVFVEKQLLSFDPKSEKFILITIVSCLSLVLIILVLLVVFLVRRRTQLKAKLVGDFGNKYDFEKVVGDEPAQEGPHNRFSLLKYIPFVGRKSDKCHPKSADQYYQDLCRMRMQKGSGYKPAGGEMTVNTTSEIHSSSPALVSPVAGPSANINSTPIRADGNGSSGSSSSNNTNNKSDSTRSSTSSWSEEPINSVNMDITTGHVILSYMEEHLNEKNRLAKEWEALSQYEPDLVKCDVGKTPQNMTKNRYSNILPYDHTRVKLTENKDNDYINANFIIDDDPKNPAYIATQGPLIHTTSDFWQMVWEQGSVLIISLCRTVEYGSLKCNQFWPANGFELYDKFEIHLVSEHVWCEDYLVRNFFLKNLETSQTRTVTQFHFLTWPENGIPSNIKSILDFRRKVNKSYKGKSSPIIVHCNDGVGRTGTYVLIDMVLNKITKGAKEIDLAATLEFLRDQRFGMVKNKSQFEFSFAVVTEEVQNMLKALNHQ